MKFSDIVRELDKYGSDDDFELVLRPIKSPVGNPEGDGDSISYAEANDFVLDDEEFSSDSSSSKLELSSEGLEVLNDISSTVEGLIDKLIEVNTHKEYSKLLKLLQSAVRLSDELIESDELLK